MTPQEASKILEMFLHKQCDLKRTEFAYNQLEVWNAVVMASEALEKQIPKKPLNLCGRYLGKAKGGNCPVCGAHTNSITHNYCRKCGQALEWSDNNAR